VNLTRPSLAANEDQNTERVKTEEAIDSVRKCDLDIDFDIEPKDLQSNEAKEQLSSYPSSTDRQVSTFLASKDQSESTSALK
jgi:hypothetical protein